VLYGLEVHLYIMSTCAIFSSISSVAEPGKQYRAGRQ